MNQESTYSRGCEVKYLVKVKTSVDLQVEFNSQRGPHIPIIWHVFTWPVSMSLVYGVSTVTKHGKW